MSPKDYGFVKHNHVQKVRTARKVLSLDPLNSVLRSKLAVELLLLRSLRNHCDINTYLPKHTQP